MQRTETRQPVWSESAKHVGYGISAAINAVLMLVVNNLLSWGWPSFITNDFAQLLPVINLSLGVTVLVNLAYISYDPPHFKSLCQMVVGATSMMVALRTWAVFPFDFPTGAGFGWTGMVRVILVMVIARDRNRHRRRRRPSGSVSHVERCDRRFRLARNSVERTAAVVVPSSDAASSYDMPHPSTSMTALR